MGIFYRATMKELREERNKVFLEKGLPILEKHGFSKSPFTTAWFGKDNHKGYSYELCRITAHSELEILEVYICFDDNWIQTHLNIFSLKPTCSSISELDGLDGLQFHLSPNNGGKTRLAPPRGRIFAGFPKHKIGIYFTKNGLSKKLSLLANMLERDLEYIENHINRWHLENKLLTTSWEGHVL